MHCLLSEFTDTLFDVVVWDQEFCLPGPTKSNDFNITVQQVLMVLIQKSATPSVCASAMSHIQHIS